LESVSVGCQISIPKWIFKEENCVEQPKEFADKENEDNVYLLKKALYDLKQVQRA